MTEWETPTCAVLQANHTFRFVDKLKTLTGMLLKMSSMFQNGGSDQMLNQMQVSDSGLHTRGRGSGSNCKGAP